MSRACEGLVQRFGVGEGRLIQPNLWKSHPGGGTRPSRLSREGRRVFRRGAGCGGLGRSPPGQGRRRAGRGPEAIPCGAGFAGRGERFHAPIVTPPWTVGIKSRGGRAGDVPGGGGMSRLVPGRSVPGVSPPGHLPACGGDWSLRSHAGQPAGACARLQRVRRNSPSARRGDSGPFAGWRRIVPDQPRPWTGSARRPSYSRQQLRFRHPRPAYRRRT